jgi:hypothetical protein
VRSSSPRYEKVGINARVLSQGDLIVSGVCRRVGASDLVYPLRVINPSHPPRAAAALAADGLHYLLAIMVQRAKEYPSRKAVEAAPALLAVLMLLVGRGVLRALR